MSSKLKKIFFLFSEIRIFKNFFFDSFKKKTRPNWKGPTLGPAPKQVKAAKKWSAIDTTPQFITAEIMEEEERQRSHQSTNQKINENKTSSPVTSSNPVILVDDSKIKALQLQLEEEKQKRHKTEAVLQDSTNKLQSSLSEKRSLETQIQELKSQLTNQQSKLQSAESQLRQENQSLEKKWKEAQSSVKDLDAIKSKFNQMERENQRLRESLDQIQNQAKNSAKSNANQALSLQQQLDKERANFNKERSQYEDQIRALTSELTSFKENMNTLAKEKTEWEEGQHPMIQGLRRQLQEQLEVNHRLEQKIQELEQQKKDTKQFSRVNQAVKNYRTIRNAKALEEELEEFKEELREEDIQAFPSVRNIFGFSEIQSQPELPQESNIQKEEDNLGTPNDSRKNTLRKQRAKRSIHNDEEDENSLATSLTLLQSCIHRILYFSISVTKEECEPLRPLLKFFFFF